MTPERALGDTEATVSRIGLGLAALGRPGYLDVGRDEDLGDARTPDAMRARTFGVLDAAYGAGVRYVDVARSYGEAERFVASWLEARGRDDVEVGSKWGYTYTARWRVDADVHEVKDHSVEALRRQLAESRSVLGVRLRLYQIHSVTPDSGVLEDRDVVRELAALRDSGVTVGLSVSGPRQAESLRRALEVEAGGGRLFGAAQATWNALERSAGDALAEAHAAGLKVIVKEAMANGRLGPRGDAAPLLAPIAERAEVGVDAVALAIVLAQPWADVVLSGAVTSDQLRSNLDAIRAARSLDLAAVPPEAEDPEAYWRRRSGLVWS
jgi:aryl-alcohol dehydrogenase-like predicted oxidoreductase